MSIFNGVWTAQNYKPIGFIINIFDEDDFLCLGQDDFGIAMEWGKIRIEELGCIERTVYYADVDFYVKGHQGATSLYLANLSSGLNGRWVYDKNDLECQNPLTEIAIGLPMATKLIICQKIWNHF